MSTNHYDIKKLCILSKLEIEESEFPKTSEKIKEVILFFNKLDEFELDEDEVIPENYVKLEKKIDDLRDDIPNINLKSNDSDNKKDISFNFHNKKNGFVIGPRI
ncbi:MAG: aspartyl/glutamyl-tRNA amidotransferase subunit C [Nitrosopumilus sp.]|nr:aspartyl/glutamyl-tRNA amidotransferase subunit C [Nitrosopumilus sp.]